MRNAQEVQEIVQGVWTNYLQRTPQRVKLIDAFMAFLVVVGGLQFVYCVLAGNYVRCLSLTPLGLYG
jgi:oligosaccharyltransferase complex subunit epsilon